MNPLVSVNLVVRNGQKYIRKSLKAALNQTYPNVKILVFDNHSKDETPEIVKKEFPQAELIRSKTNYGFGGGQNRCLGCNNSKYLIALSADVIMDKDFVKEGVAMMEKNPRIGALQGKTLRYDFNTLKPVTEEGIPVIDTTGFQIFRSRRLINRGHGEKDKNQFSQPEEIFSYEGASGFFRREALEDAKVEGELFDEDLYWYATDIDLGWRLRLLGWKSFYNPQMMSFHDRPTTNRLSTSYKDFINLRKQIPPLKRKLDYRNYHLVLLKYSFPQNIFRDLGPFLARELQLLGYVLVFEPFVLAEFPRFLRLLPKIIKKRQNIMSRRKVDAREMGEWFE